MAMCNALLSTHLISNVVKTWRKKLGTNLPTQKFTGTEGIKGTVLSWLRPEEAGGCIGGDAYDKKCNEMRCRCEYPNIGGRIPRFEPVAFALPALILACKPQGIWTRNHDDTVTEVWETEITRLQIKMRKFEAIFNMSPFQFPVPCSSLTPWPHGLRSRLRWLALELKDTRLEERIDGGKIGFSMWQRPPVASKAKWCENLPENLRPSK